MMEVTLFVAGLSVIVLIGLDLYNSRTLADHIETHEDEKEAIGDLFESLSEAITELAEAIDQIEHQSTISKEDIRDLKVDFVAANNNRRPRFAGVATATVTKSTETPSAETPILKREKMMVVARTIGKAGAYTDLDADLETLMTTKQAKEYVGTCVYHQAAEGRIGTKIGSGYVFTKAELDYWIANRVGKGRPANGTKPICTPAELRFQGGKV